MTSSQRLVIRAGFQVLLTSHHYVALLEYLSTRTLCIAPHPKPRHGLRAAVAFTHFSCSRLTRIRVYKNTKRLVCHPIHDDQGLQPLPRAIAEALREGLSVDCHDAHLDVHFGSELKLVKGAVSRCFVIIFDPFPDRNNATRSADKLKRGLLLMRSNIVRECVG